MSISNTAVWRPNGVEFKVIPPRSRSILSMVQLVIIASVASVDYGGKRKVRRNGQAQVGCANFDLKRVGCNVIERPFGRQRINVTIGKINATTRTAVWTITGAAQAPLALKGFALPLVAGLPEDFELKDWSSPIMIVAVLRRNGMKLVWINAVIGICHVRCTTNATRNRLSSIALVAEITLLAIIVGVAVALALSERVGRAYLKRKQIRR
jgi:hypothetical protein